MVEKIEDEVDFVTPDVELAYLKQAKEYIEQNPIMEYHGLCDMWEAVIGDEIVGCQTLCDVMDRDTEYGFGYIEKQHHTELRLKCINKAIKILETK